MVQERDGALKREGEKGFFGLIRGKKIRTKWKREEKVEEEDTWVLNMHQEKILSMVNFLIFVHKNVYRIRFQEIKIRPLKGFEKFAFWFFAHYKISPSKGPKYP